MIVYDTEGSALRSAFKGSLARINPTSQYLRHYDSHLYLTFIYTNGTRQEQHQASKELDVCDKKMKYWKSRPGFDQEQATKQVEIMNKKWK